MVTTAGREAEEAAEAASRGEWTRSFLEATVEATADGILVVDRRGRVVFANERFSALWGLPASIAATDEEALNEAILAQVEDPSGVRASLLDHQIAPERESRELVRLRDGRVVERQSRPQWLSGRVIGRVWTYRDVSERELLLRRTFLVADATRLLASLEVDSALRGVAELTLRSLADACAIDLFSGGSQRRLVAVARDPRRTFAPAIHPAVMGERPARFDVEGISHLAVPFPSKDGVLGAMTLAAPPGRRFLDDDLDVARDLGLRAGLSIENATLYRRAQEAVAARDEFLSIASHEIRGPIAALHLATQLLRRGGASAESQARTFDIIEREDRRLSRFVDELLDVTRIRGDALPFRFELVELGEVVRAAASRLEPELTRSGSHLSIDVDQPVTGQWDAFRLDQVVTNLLTNAIKFGLGQPIEIQVRSADNHAQLVIQDRGMGIAPEARERIFRPFSRGVSARHYGGLGLGLYIVKTIVDALGGEIRVDSSPRFGTRFTIELPKTRAAR